MIVFVPMPGKSCSDIALNANNDSSYF